VSPPGFRRNQGATPATCLVHGALAHASAREVDGATYAGGVTRPLRDVPARADLLLDALGSALDGTGPAVRVVTGPPSAREQRVADDVALAVATSGSTGEPRTALLTADALVASARATGRRLAGPGRWLLTLPVDHVAGLQVLVRSVLAGTRPVVAAGGPFTARGFAAAVESFAGSSHDGLPRYTSLVPTQLHRVLDDTVATAAARTFTAVLVGGAATAAPLLARARDAGLRVVTTYGMTETCGGCVYDGVPLDGVHVAVDDDGRVLLGGDVLMSGYLEPGTQAAGPGPFVGRDGVRYLRTSDVGRLDAGVLTVLGRADDVVVTGGVNVAPAAVEASLARFPQVADALVVGVPDDEWGQAVAAVVVLAPGTQPDDEAVRDLRAHVARDLGPAHAPRHVLVVDAVPLRGPGKPDRRAARALVVDRLTRESG